MRLLILALFFLTACPASDRVIIYTHSGSQKVFVEIADSDQERQRGLMGRTELSENFGMFFVWPHEVMTSFWMKDTPLSLDIIFIDNNKRIVFMAQATTPFSEKLITPGRPCRYVLEVKAGYVKKHEVRIGDKIDTPI